MYILIILLIAWSFFLSAVARILMCNSMPIVITCEPCSATETPPTCHTYYHCFWNGSCKVCNTPFIRLTPWLELASTAFFYTLLQIQDAPYIYAYFILCSALIITIKTDLEYLLISRFVSLFLVPIGILMSSIGWLPITAFESCISALTAYCLFYGCAWLFTKLTGKYGLGQGDWELMALIGSFLGALGSWITVTIGSTLGTVVGCCYLLYTHQSTNRHLPFGPFLAIGALSFVLLQKQLFNFL